ncbi:MAG: hypothetical protein RLZZ540_3325, partial [Bacteroidota bacterium]
PIACFGGTTNVTLNTTGGSGTYTYNVANPATTALGAGTYTYKVTDANGCEATATVTINAAPAAPSAPTVPLDVTLCENGTEQTLTAKATVPQGSTITWYDAPTAGNIVSPVLVSTTAATKTVYGQTSNGTCFSLTRTAVTLTINAAPAPTIITVPDFINSVNGTPVDLRSYLPQDAPENGTWVDVNNSGALNGSILDPNNVATANYSFQYTIETNTCPISYVINLKIDQSFVLGCGTIFVHNAFTPNGDGVNEVFKIDNIEDTLCYPENSVEIYNRWGILVFETKGYDNVNKAFKGYSEGRVTVDKSSGLPTGTYFYILSYTSVGLQNEIIAKKEQGYLYLSK